MSHKPGKIKTKILLWTNFSSNSLEKKMNEVVGKMNVQIYIIVSSLDGAEFLLFRVAPSIKFSSYKSHLNGVLILDGVSV